MSIAKNKVLSDSTHASDVPASWYLLSRLDASIPEAALETEVEGRPDPGLIRKEVEEVIQKYKEECLPLDEFPSRLIWMWSFFDDHKNIDKVSSKLTSSEEDVELTSGDLRTLACHIDKLADIVAAREAAEEKRDKEQRRKGCRRMARGSRCPRR